MSNRLVSSRIWGQAPEPPQLAALEDVFYTIRIYEEHADSDFKWSNSLIVCLHGSGSRRASGASFVSVMKINYSKWRTGQYTKDKPSRPSPVPALKLDLIQTFKGPFPFLMQATSSSFTPCKETTSGSLILSDSAVHLAIYWLLRQEAEWLSG
ncbi:predicted protein [Botrytis cinerea T4]|uniref:Uncharacterized protein n=1 Tax=Botryotinia fuckeliana (strain T4) TaxID=999810 RepID=G2Y8G5_BOTF4|nr:predicted protein [Botrytis cinerea T4]